MVCPWVSVFVQDEDVGRGGVLPHRPRVPVTSLLPGHVQCPCEHRVLVLVPKQRPLHKPCSPCWLCPLGSGRKVGCREGLAPRGTLWLSVQWRLSARFPDAPGGRQGPSLARGEDRRVPWVGAATPSLGLQLTGACVLLTIQVLGSGLCGGNQPERLSG